MTSDEIQRYLGALNSNTVCGKPPGTLLIYEATIHGKIMPPGDRVERGGVTFLAQYKADGWNTAAATDGKPYPITPQPYTRSIHIPDTLDVTVKDYKPSIWELPNFVWHEVPAL